MSQFEKISELSPKDSKKVKNYWTDLWGPDYSGAAVKNYEPDGKKKEVKAEAEDQKEVKAEKEIKKIEL